MREAQVWYASPAKMASRTKLLVMDDRGTLFYRRGTVEFQGKRWRLASSQIEDVGLVRPHFPYLGFLVSISISFGIMALYILWLDPSMLLIFAIVIPLSLIPGLLVNRKQRFVHIEAIDDEGQRFEANFHVSSRMGWAGLLGANEDLAEAIRP